MGCKLGTDGNAASSRNARWRFPEIAWTCTLCTWRFRRLARCPLSPSRLSSLRYEQSDQLHERDDVLLCTFNLGQNKKRVRSGALETEEGTRPSVESGAALGMSTWETRSSASSPCPRCPGRTLNHFSSFLHVMLRSTTKRKMTACKGTLLCRQGGCTVRSAIHLSAILLSQRIDSPTIKRIPSFTLPSR